MVEKLLYLHKYLAFCASNYKNKKATTYFPIIVNICVNHGHVSKQKQANDIHPGLTFAPHYICSICAAIGPQMPPVFFYNLYGLVYLEAVYEISN